MNIVSLVQTNLSKNFTALLKRLSLHDAQISHTNTLLQQQAATFGNQFSLLESRMAEQTALLTGRIQDLFSQMQELEERQLSLKDHTEENSSGVQKLNQ